MIGKLKVAPDSLPTTVMLVEVCEVIDLAITFTEVPVIVIERFLSLSFKNTGVVTPVLIGKSSSLPSPAGFAKGASALSAAALGLTSPLLIS